MSFKLQQIRAKLAAGQNTSVPVAPASLSPAKQVLFNTIANNKLFKAQKPHWHKHFSCLPAITNHRNQTIKGLVSDLNDTASMELAFNIFSCAKSKPCRSPFCPFCRATMQANAAASCQRIFGQSPKNDLCFLTVLLPVTYTPNTDTSALINSCRKSLANIFNYRQFKNIVLYGFFEIDIKTPALVAGKTRSEQVLKALDFQPLNNQPAYLVHFHALVDLKGHSKNAFRQSLTRVFNKPYQVRLSALRSDLSKQDSITNIANYMLKFRTQHSNNLFGNQASGKAMYGRFYGNSLLRDYVKLIHSLLVQNKISCLSIRKNC